jgi:3-(3-hydroxy-phenyl)propionate hydroxylase
VAVWRMSALAADLPRMLGARADEVWLVRPDAHVAAVVSPMHELRMEQALHRLLALPLSLAV